ncbi:MULTISPECIES: DUF6488 family protein [Alteromonadales]|jgi:hypothetical protein|uniref:DUF6488 family protein n=1 Tax=Alteromonadales TaxID=135622 RepID=UPI0012310974|nr:MULTISPECIES: DUF6488 family protein [Alteromonadales]MBH0067451.1 hypothetical protein [Pseudoalteromonas sp. NZS100]
MNKIISIIALCTALLSLNVYAHSDHGVISGQKALVIAATAINKMTFKDVGFSIGKLDDTWKSLEKSQFTISSVEDSYYVVSANNPKSDKKIYFKIAKNGEVLAANNHNNF